MHLRKKRYTLEIDFFKGLFGVNLVGVVVGVDFGFRWKWRFDFVADNGSIGRTGYQYNGALR